MHRHPATHWRIQADRYAFRKPVTLRLSPWGSDQVIQHFPWPLKRSHAGLWAKSQRQESSMQVRTQLLTQSNPVTYSTAAIIISLVSGLTVHLRCLVEGLDELLPLLMQSEVHSSGFGDLKDSFFFVPFILTVCTKAEWSWFLQCYNVKCHPSYQHLHSRLSSNQRIFETRFDLQNSVSQMKTGTTLKLHSNMCFISLDVGHHLDIFKGMTIADSMLHWKQIHLWWRRRGGNRI